MSAPTRRPRVNVPQGTPSYMAPEIVKGTSGSRKSDIWGVGITLLEMLTGKTGYDLSNKFALMFAIGRGALPEIPPGIDQQAATLITSCTKLLATERPTASEILRHPFVNGACAVHREGDCETQVAVLNLAATFSKLQVFSSGARAAGHSVMRISQDSGRLESEELSALGP
mmetsp:Transcript_39749/g.62065  ORF Transcript_39749/g.62065 Transcript_39749/m.62065 type:complete len:171 (-) Transcript_39749:92-604(-)